MVAMSDMARRFKLGSELLLSAITARLGTIVHGRLESGILYTAAYIARIKAQVGLLKPPTLCATVTTTRHAYKRQTVAQSKPSEGMLGRGI